MNKPIELSTSSGSESFGELSVSWDSRYMATEHYQVCCLLKLGNDSQEILLNAETPERSFVLLDVVEDEVAWGWLSLIEDCHDILILKITYHLNSTISEYGTLCDWTVCNLCDEQTPISCEAVFADGLIQTETKISGSDSACLLASVLMFVDGQKYRHSLSPLDPNWSARQSHSKGYLLWDINLSINNYGKASLQGEFAYAKKNQEQTAILGRWFYEHPHSPLPLPPPIPPPHPPPCERDDLEIETVIIGGMRPLQELGTFTYPCGLSLPTQNEKLLRFFSIANDSTFQKNLVTARSGDDARVTMINDASDFVRPDSKNYKGQYVSDVGKLKGGMGYLVNPEICVFLNQEFVDLKQLRYGFHTLLHESAEDFLAYKSYAEQKQNLQNSLLALIVLGGSDSSTEGDGDKQDKLIRPLMVCHIAELIQNNASILCISESIRDAQQANSKVPFTIMPLPDKKTKSQNDSEIQGYFCPLGISELKVIKQRLRRYDFGELAHVENVMGREYKQRAREHRFQHEDGHTEKFEYRDQEKVEQRLSGGTHTHPLTDLKREFDDLKKTYNDDGLSVKVTGGWTDCHGVYTPQTSGSNNIADETSTTGSSDFTITTSAEDFAREILEIAATRVTRRVNFERQQRVEEEFIAQDLHRYDNAESDKNIVGLYCWIDEVYRAYLQHRGYRLTLEFVLDEPAAEYIAQLNSLLQLELVAPIAPWIGGDGIDPIASPADISRTNYAQLAARYDAEAVLPPPDSTCIIATGFQNDPPKTSTILEVPQGYIANKADISYACTDEDSKAVLNILVGSQAKSLDCSSSPGTASIATLNNEDRRLPVLLMSTAKVFTVNVEVICNCDDTSLLFTQWQVNTYNAIIKSYRCEKEKYFSGMQAAFDESMQSLSVDNNMIEHTALQRRAIQTLLAPFKENAGSGSTNACYQDVINFNLIPFFSRAFDWQDIIFTYYAKYFSADDETRPDWITLIQTQSQSGKLKEFLLAGAARVLVTVQPTYTLPILYYLASKGQFWFGENKLCPVYEQDINLVNQWKSLDRIESESGHSESCNNKEWDVRVATTMMFLQNDARLPIYE